MKRIRLMVMWGFMRNGIYPSVQNKKPGFGLGLVLVIAAVAGLLFTACNTEPEIEHRIDLFLNDSLSKDAGKYDSLAITILDTSGGVIRANAFNGPYLAKPNGNVLKGIVLGNFQPAAYVIDIRAFQSGEEKVRVQIKVAGDVVSPIVRVYTENPNPNTNGKTDTVPTGVDIAETEMNFAFEDAPRALTAKLKPDSARGQILWSSNKTTVATVSGEGLVSPHDTGTAMVFASVVGHAHLKDSVMVRVVIPITLQALAIQRTVPVLFTGGPTHKIGITYEPSNQTPIVTWKSSDTTTVRVNAEGTVTGLKAGQALITVTASGANPLSDTLTVTVRKDAPILVVSPDQQVDVGQAVTFRLNASQQFGTLTLSWDFTGDGLPEGSANSQSLIDSATATHTYATAGNYEAVFTAKDGEGNETQVKRRVVVGKQGPLIVITSPKQDTTVNTVQFMVRYTSDGAPLSEVFNLKSGLNTLWVKATNALGTDSVAVRVTLDTIPPTPPTFDVARTTTSPTNVKKPTWTWSPGTGGIGVFRWSLNTTPAISREDTSKTYTPTVDLDDGSYTLTVSERDSVGNWSAQVSREIVIQTAGPLPPRVTASAALTRLAPTFSWTGTGRTGARFRVRLYKAGTIAPLDSLETTTLIYAPAAALFATSDDVVFTLRVREQDGLGNWGGDGSAEVRVDNVAPARPVFTAQPPAMVNAADTRTSLQWTWGRVGVADSFVVTLNDVAQPKQAGTTYSLTTFPDGNYALSVVAVDPAGNTSTAAAANAVVVDKTPPARPLRITTASPTAAANPVFTWTSGGGGEGVYQVKMDNNNFTVGATQANAATYTATALSEGTHILYVRERDSAGNWSLPDTGSVWVDRTNPTLTNPGNRSITTTSTSISFSASDGSGTGVKNATCRWGAATVDASYSGGTWNCAITGLNSAQTQVTLEVVDGVGLKANASLTITVNLPTEQVVVSPKFKRYATALTYVTVDYTLGGVARRIDFTSLTPGENRLPITGPANAIGQVSRDTAFVYSHPNVIFVDKNAIGTQTGTSWENAYISLSDALSSTKGYTSGTNIWVTSGVYGSTVESLGLWVSNGVELFGGFPGDGSGVGVESRNLSNPTVISENAPWKSMVTLSSNSTIDNFKLLHINNYSGALHVNGSNIKVRNTSMDGWWVGDNSYVGISSNSTVTFENSSMSNSEFAFFYLISIGESCNVDFVSTKINDNKAGLVGFPYPVIDVGANTKIRLLNSSEIRGSNNAGVPMPAVNLGDGAEMSISSNSTVNTPITGTGKSCTGNSLPCP